MEDWDPRKDAFKDKHFNSYKEGVGRDLLWSAQRNGGIRLLVQNIPLTLGKEGFYNMFAEHGRVLNRTLIQPTDDNKQRGAHGYVTMENLVDAQAAISHLDGKKMGHLILRVNPALTNEERDRRRRLQQEDEIFTASVRRDIAARHEDPSAHTAISGDNSQGKNPVRVSPRMEGLQSVSGLNTGAGDWHSQSKTANNSGKMETKSPVSIGRGRSRHVIERGDNFRLQREDMNHSTGIGVRGPVSTAHQDQVPHSIQNMSGSYHGVGRGNFKFAERKFSPPQNEQLKKVKLCVFCYKEDCTFVCSRCKMYYCSVDCQKKDWPRHKNICLCIGVMVNDRSTVGIEGSTIENDKDICYATDVESNKSKQMENASRSERDFDSDSTESRTKGKKIRSLNLDQQVIGDKTGYLSEAGKVQTGSNNHMKGGSKSLDAISGRPQGEKTVASQSYGENKFNNGPVNNHRAGFQRYQDEKTTKASGTFQSTENMNRLRNGRNDRKENNLNTSETVSQRKQDRSSRNGASEFAENFNKMHTGRDDKKENNLNTVSQRNQGRNPTHGTSPGLEDQSMNSKSQIANSEKQVDKKYQGKDFTEDSDRSPNTQNRAADKSPGSHNQSRGTGNVGDRSPKAEQTRNQSPAVAELILPAKISGQCYLTYYESPYKFWISMVEFLEPFAEVTLLMEKELPLNCAGAPLSCMVGETFGIKHFEEWRRVTILSVRGQDVTVFFVDYGNTTNAKCEDLRPLTVDMLQLPAQAVCCCVSNLKPRGSETWSEAAVRVAGDWLAEPLSRYMQFEVVAKKNSLHAVNIIVNNESLSKFLLTKGVAEYVDHQPGLLYPSKNEDKKPPRLMASFLTSKMGEVKEGDSLSVTITDFISAEKIFVQDDTSSSVLNDLASLLQSECSNSTEPYRPVPGELVAARFSADGKWYRAEVVSIDCDSCNLIYVDYGNSEVQMMKNIRPVINKQLMTVPKQALICSWFNLQQAVSDFGLDSVSEMLEKYLLASFSTGRKCSFLIKSKAKDILFVDSVTNGLPLSQTVMKSLQNISSGVPLKDFISEGYKASSSTVSSAAFLPSHAENAQKPVQKQDMTMADLGTETLGRAPGETVSVFVSFVKSPDEFYVRLNSKQDLFISMMKELNRSVGSSPALSSPSVGKLTAVQYDRDHVWYRGMIEKIDDGQCQVCFIDYGNREETKISSLKVLQASAYHIPAQAVKCCLENKPKDMSEASVLKFKNQLESSSVDVKICQINEGSFFVQVFQGGTDIGATLLEKKSSKQDVQILPQKTGSAINCSGLSLETQTLPATGERISATVGHIDSLSKLYICRTDEHLTTELFHLMVKLNDCANSLPCLDNSAVGSVCAAQFSKDGTWYRARVVEKHNPATCIVQFVDYGNLEEIRVSDLKKIDSSMTKLTAQAVRCCLYGYESELSLTSPVKSVPDVTVELIRKLQTETLNKPVKVRVLDKKQDIWIIKLENEHGESLGQKLPMLPTPRLSDLKFVTPTEKEFDAIISFIKSVTDFCCQKSDVALQEELNCLSELLRDDVSKLDTEAQCAPVVGGVYTSKFEGLWYRCVVEQVMDSKVLIRYFDYGNSEEISADQLKPLNLERLLVPVSLVKCKLYGVTQVQESYSDSVFQFLMNLQQQVIHLVIRAREEDGTFLVSVSTQDGDMAEYLTNKGVAKISQAISPPKEEKRSFLRGSQTSFQQAGSTEPENEEDDDEEDLLRKIQELQMQLQKSQLKKKLKR